MSLKFKVGVQSQKSKEPRGKKKMEKKISSTKCPKCGKEAIVESKGDLNSGWSGKSWGEGTYSEGVVVHNIECHYCHFSDCEVEVHD